MIKKTFTLFLACSALSGCVLHEKPCEDIVSMSEQHEQCSQLHRQIVAAKNNPILRTELERRYQLDCVESRYYRDDHGAMACANKEGVKKAIENHKQDN